MTNGTAGPPRVSVALATFNGARFITAQLESIASQTCQPHELVVGDDGSTDETVALVERFGSRVGFPVRVTLNPQRSGYIRNFMDVARRCSGDVVAFCDQDDIWLPRKLERCGAAFGDPTVMVAMHSSDVVDSHLRPLNVRLPDVHADTVAERLEVNPWHPAPGFSLLFRRSLLRLVQDANVPEDPMGEGEPTGHDHWVYMLGAAVGRTALVAESLANYRRHSSNTTSPVRHGLLWSLSLSVRAGGDRYAFLARVAAQRAELFAGLANESIGEESAFLSEASRYYDSLAGTLSLRAAIHARRGTPVSRLRSMRRLAVHHGYRDTRLGGFGRRAVFKDGLRCFLPNPLA